MSERKPRLLLTGAAGMLGSMFLQRMPAFYELHAYNHQELDVTQPDQVREVVARIRPQVIVNCAGLSEISACESSREVALLVNGVAPGILAQVAREAEAVLVHFSTDQVFDGCQREPYREDDPANPLSVFGLSKLRGEQAIQNSGLVRYFIIRTSRLFGPGGANNFVDDVISFACDQEELRAAADQIACPTYTRDLALAVFRLLEAPRHIEIREVGSPYGLYHFAGEGQCSWFEFAEDIISLLRRYVEPVRVKRVVPVHTNAGADAGNVPLYTVLSKEKYKRMTGALVAHWRQGLKDYLEVKFTSKSELPGVKE